MDHYIEKLPKDILDLIYRIRDISGALHMPAYLVGGFVRDLLLGAKDFDLDIAVVGSGIALAARFCQGLDCRLVRHTRFGTATVHLLQRSIDFASTRSETYPQPAALPVVRASTLKDDLGRRDFTINTLALSVSGQSFGTLVDLFEGRNDLRAGIVRVLHDRSFIDDPTRIVRAVRFEQRFGFRISPHTLRLLKNARKDCMLQKVQPQRLRDELVLMMKEPAPEKTIVRLNTLTGWDFVSPQLTAGIRSAARLFPRIRAEVAWFERHNSSLRPVDITVMYLGALFSAVSSAAALSVCRKFGFGKGERKMIISYGAVRSKIEATLARKTVAPSVVFNLLDSLPYEVTLLSRAQSRRITVKRHIAEFFSKYHGTRISISGDDLKGLGVTPGPEYQRIFRSLLDAKLNGAVSTKDEELEFVRVLRTGKDTQ